MFCCFVCIRSTQLLFCYTAESQTALPILYNNWYVSPSLKIATSLGNLDPRLKHGSSDPHEPASTTASLSQRVTNTYKQTHRHTDTQTSVAIGRISALHAGNEAWKSFSRRKRPTTVSGNFWRRSKAGSRQVAPVVTGIDRSLICSKPVAIRNSKTSPTYHPTAWSRRWWQVRDSR